MRQSRLAGINVGATAPRRFQLSLPLLSMDVSSLNWAARMRRLFFCIRLF
jgi:hypothetical protein